MGKETRIDVRTNIVDNGGKEPFAILLALVTGMVIHLPSHSSVMPALNPGGHLSSIGGFTAAKLTGSPATPPHL